MSGNATLNDGNITLNNFNLYGGTVDGSGTLTVNGMMFWTGGTMSGSGVTNVNGNVGSAEPRPLTAEL